MAYIIGFIIVLLVVGGAVVSMYNGMVGLRNKLQESWRQVDVELNRRYDLIPNLVEIAKGYAFNERETLERVVSLRSQAQQLAQGNGGAASPQRAEVEQQLTAAVTQFFAVSEAYPELRSNENFVRLQAEVTETENRIANSRRYYNAIVGNYNTKTEAFPSNLIAGVFGFQKAGYFEVNDPTIRARVDINLSEIGGNARQQAHSQLTSAGEAAGTLPPVSIDGSTFGAAPAATPVSAPAYQPAPQIQPPAQPYPPVA
ncbi:MAG: LemA family protein [Propionibacteriaceae bacterium]|jgi:LemA protein|nr:LemA family protein [Propionibacteriaceae bacterium]